MSTEVSAPTLRVVAGQPTAEELAALVVVLAARSGGEAREAQAPGAGSAWTDRSRYVRSSRWGFGARSGWRASALPR